MPEHACGAARAADITPETKVGELLDRWPALEAALVAISPHFEALKNPILRRTVAKVATLRNVSKVSGVPLGELVSRLRAAAGLAPLAVADEPGARGRPPWAVEARVTRRHDARATIAGGGHPLEAVMGDLAALGPGEVYALVTPFVPAPLLDRAQAKGFLAHAEDDASGAVTTYFTPAP
jgi:hypothetical protein